MRSAIAGLMILIAGAAGAQNVAERIALDGAVIDRVGEAANRDLPRDLLKRMVDEDIELMRGRRADGTYEHATYERFEAGRISDTFSIKPSEASMQTLEMKGPFVYRVILDVPERRLLVRKNRPVWVERVDFEYVGESGRNEQGSVGIQAFIEPGTIRPVDLPVVARQATVRVVARTDEQGGYGNITISLVQARIVDNLDSPWAEAVAGAKTALRALEQNDVAALRSAAQRMRAATAENRPRPPVQEGAPPVADTAAAIELQAELQLIEDLLTGTDAERREGMDRLHQLVRKVRK
jgi:hypothetical protein